MLPDWLTPEMFCIFLAAMAATCWTFISIQFAPGTGAGELPQGRGRHLNSAHARVPGAFPQQRRRSDG